MNPLRVGLSWLLTAFAAYVVVMNYMCVVANYRNTRRGIDRSHSTVPLIVLILCAVADLVARGQGLPCAPRPLLLALVVMDPGSWILAALPFALLRRRK